MRCVKLETVEGKNCRHLQQYARRHSSGTDKHSFRRQIFTGLVIVNTTVETAYPLLRLGNRYVKDTTPWYFKLSFLAHMFIKAASSPTLLPKLKRIVWPSSLLWRELGTNFPRSHVLMSDCSPVFRYVLYIVCSSQSTTMIMSRRSVNLTTLLRPVRVHFLSPVAIESAVGREWL